jgi:hypothetical protein
MSRGIGPKSAYRVLHGDERRTWHPRVDRPAAVTLIVARMLADGPHLVCDSQLTDAAGERLNPYSSGALKLVICGRSLCIGFDGGEYTARRAILEIAAGLRSGFDLAEVRRSLVLASRGGTSGFIVAALSPGRALIRIRGGHDEGEIPAAWLGEQPAFDSFQRRLAAAGSLRHELQHGHHSHLTSAEREIASRLLPALMGVIEDACFPGVGGMPICVVPSSRGFRYESVAMLATDPYQPEDEGEDSPEPDWGTAAEGRFGYAIKVPGVAGIGAIGAYFPHDCLGVLYHPGVRERPYLYRGVDDSGFGAAVLKDFGFAFDRRALRFPSTHSGVPSLEVGAGPRP